MDYLFQTTFNIIMLLKYHNQTCKDEFFELPKKLTRPRPVIIQVGSSGETKAVTSSGHFNGSESDNSNSNNGTKSNSNFYK